MDDRGLSACIYAEVRIFLMDFVQVYTICSYMPVPNGKVETYYYSEKPLAGLP